MIRVLLITAAASFVLALACFAGAAALGGRGLFEHGWTIPAAEFWTDDENVHISIGEAFDPDQVPDLEPATNAADEEPVTNEVEETPPPKA